MSRGAPFTLAVPDAIVLRGGEAGRLANSVLRQRADIVRLSTGNGKLRSTVESQHDDGESDL